MGITRKTALAQLDALVKAAHDQFDYPGSAARLVQLDHHVATVRMVVDHLFDESSRSSKEGR